MASGDVIRKSGETAVKTIANLAEEAREGVKDPTPSILIICKSLIAGVSRTAVAPLEWMKIMPQDAHLLDGDDFKGIFRSSYQFHFCGFFTKQV